LPDFPEILFLHAIFGLRQKRTRPRYRVNQDGRSGVVDKKTFCLNTAISGFLL